eukprot:c10866_g1_i1.p1 GENE.c10866_g1_i1~~c10866_g1_i1.p1  ORF type:complete len:138 (-),score=22.96 c10866_g1_i1:350-763(-)
MDELIDTDFLSRSVGGQRAERTYCCVGLLTKKKKRGEGAQAEESDDDEEEGQTKKKKVKGAVNRDIYPVLALTILSSTYALFSTVAYASDKRTMSDFRVWWLLLGIVAVSVAITATKLRMRQGEGGLRELTCSCGIV